jgi:cytochrome c556
MNRYALAVVTLALGITAVVVSERTATAEPATARDTSALPASLENLYPPGAAAPLFLISKIEMATRFSGIVGDLFENDPVNAQKNYETFRQQYIGMATMVPEWRDGFPLAPVDELGSALSSGDQPLVMKALEGVGAVCHSCHLDNMARVQQKYHWGDFSGLALTDPVTGEEVSFARLMLAIQFNMAGVGIDLEQGQKENAQKQLAGFKARFAVFKETCQACHDSERKYFVDASIDGMVDRLAAQLEQATPDPKAVGELLHGIGQESCSKCHLVHIPAAYAQEQLGGGHAGAN